MNEWAKIVENILDDLNYFASKERTVNAWIKGLFISLLRCLWIQDSDLVIKMVEKRKWLHFKNELQLWNDNKIQRNYGKSLQRKKQ